MRSHDEIIKRVVTVAEEDERIRGVILEGSRADPQRLPDLFQDYDVVYFVRDVTPFVRKRTWAEQFGDILLLQQPEDMDDPPPARDGTWAYLMLFRDGTRIDLTLRSLDSLDTSMPAAGVVLLDKDRRFDDHAGVHHTPPQPTAKAFADCCNEFHWVSTNVAKGLWRDETVYAKTMLEQFVRPQAMRMLDWYIATERRLDPGLFGRRYRELLSGMLWDGWVLSYSALDTHRSWDALFALHSVFRTAATVVGQRLGYAYPVSEGEDVRGYLERVRRLPRDARIIL